MRQDVLAILKTSARRMLVVRAAEAAALGAIAGGIACAGAQAAMLIDAPAALAAIVAVALPVAAAIAMILWRGVGRILALGRHMRYLLAVEMVLFCVVAVFLVASGGLAEVHRLWLAVVGIPVGAAIPAGVVLLRGQSLRDAAMHLDSKFALAERLSTAAELARAQAPEQPRFAAEVYAQAAQVAREKQLLRVSLASRGRPTIGALGLVILLCLALGLVAVRDRHAVLADIRDVVAGAQEMTPAQRQELARRLLAAAQAAGKEQDAAAALQSAALAAQAKDPDVLKEAMRRLEQMVASGQVKLSLVPDLSPSATRVADSFGGGGASGRWDDTAAVPRPLPPAIKPDAMQLIYHPGYSNLVTSAPSPSAVGAGAYWDFDQAWNSARLRASQRLRANQVPPQYRQLVRDFFMTQEK